VQAYNSQTQAAVAFCPVPRDILTDFGRTLLGAPHSCMRSQRYALLGSLSLPHRE
jgi:hypothetical protein